MILTCPACSVRYLVDARALGVRGRNVRCARCSHTWYQAPPDEGPPAAAPAPLAPPPPAPPPAPPSSPRPLAPSADQRIRLPALAPPKRNWGRTLAWPAAAALIVVLVGVAILERNQVASLVPATAPLYALIGFPPNDVGAGLEFRNVTTSRDTENGLPSLVIDGVLANVSTVPRPVPKLIAVLRDRGQHELQDWTFSAPAERLGPGETVTFHTSIAQPAEAAAGVVVTFAGSGS
jgi:predicted Zn finger-like uncharacterized protein